MSVDATARFAHHYGNYTKCSILKKNQPLFWSRSDPLKLSLNLIKYRVWSTLAGIFSSLDSLYLKIDFANEHPADVKWNADAVAINAIDK